MDYKDADFKIPIESNSYKRNSDFICNSINSIINERIITKNNRIIINTNLKKGLPLENINKIAGPMVEAWCGEVFSDIKDNLNNRYKLINVEVQQRLGVADIVLQFKIENEYCTSNIDVKATAEDIPSSGRGPNITSYSRIRTEYIKDPDFMFVILSVKHKVFSQRNENSLLVYGIMEITSANAYDLKYISDNDINYNPSLGTGQIQIKDIHYIKYQYRTTWEFCQLLDKKYLNSSRRTIDDWFREARMHEWIKN